MRTIWMLRAVVPLLLAASFIYTMNLYIFGLALIAVVGYIIDFWVHTDPAKEQSTYSWPARYTRKD